MSHPASKVSETKRTMVSRRTIYEAWQLWERAYFRSDGCLHGWANVERADDKTAPHGYAHQIAPFAIKQPQRPQSPELHAQPRISVWDRGVTRAHQVKKQKRVEFIQQVSEQNGH